MNSASKSAWYVCGALISSYLGDTASHLQMVFDAAQQTPMVVLFDEIDTVAKSRDDSRDVGELKRVVNSLLQAMDTFTAKESILIGQAITSICLTRQSGVVLMMLSCCHCRQWR
jgi:SpoVK/Ycf46/Vps4 family AAA+-type ATPase